MTYMDVSGVTSFFVGLCGNHLSWHDSSPKRACGVPVNEVTQKRDVVETTVMSWRQRNMKVLARQHEECRYRFRWRGLIVGTTGVYPPVPRKLCINSYHILPQLVNGFPFLRSRNGKAAEFVKYSVPTAV
ncbi:hypothetical protein YC2023_075544 [Brassica napus]